MRAHKIHVSLSFEMKTQSIKAIVATVIMGALALHAEDQTAVSPDSFSNEKQLAQQFADQSELEGKSIEASRIVEDLQSRSNELGAKLTEIQNNNLDETTKSILAEKATIDEATKIAESQKEELTKKVDELSQASQSAKSEEEIRNIENAKADIKSKIEDLNKVSADSHAKSEEVAAKLTEIQYSKADDATRALMDEKTKIDAELKSAVLKQAEINTLVADGKSNGSLNSKIDRENADYSAQIDSLSKGEGADIRQSDAKVDGEKSEKPVVKESESSKSDKERSYNEGFAVAAPGAPAPPITACLAFAGVLLLQAFRRTKSVA